MPNSRKGVRVALSPARRIVVELMHHARKVPSLPLKRTINIAALVQARQRCEMRPSWIALFLKAYALVALHRPELRRAYVGWPTPSLYEHPFSICSVLVEREWYGEKIVLGAKIRAPDEQPVSAIDEHLHRLATAPLEDISEFRQLLNLGRVPGLLRRFVFWNSLHLSGFKKCKRFGTFMVSSLGNLGVEQCHPLTPLTTYLSFGPISDAGDVTVLLVYDHRVMDGRTVGQALVDVEAALNGPILAELQHQPLREAA
jgi:pyruvate/2-oxoglutarate dehydrogenase complex dihydrolipoamide acyltransferase (E2) component